jgi:WD40 repeat protein
MILMIMTCVCCTKKVFALVTVSGSLIIYSMHVSSRAILKVAAHTGDATTLDWHPTRPYVIATGGSNDRTVKGKFYPALLHLWFLTLFPLAQWNFSNFFLFLNISVGC